MTIEVGVFEAKTHLSALLDQVVAGEDFLITKRGQVVARLGPAVEPGSRVDEAYRLLALARSNSNPGPDSIRELIDDGRYK
jgi:prevent-host-death family protein